MTDTMNDRPFDGRLKTNCVKREPDGTAPSVIVCIQNPDYIPVHQRAEGSRLVRPTPTSDYKPLSSSEYKEILINAGVTSSPPDTFGIAGAGTDAKTLSSGNNAKRKYMPVRPEELDPTCNIDNSNCNTRTKIYALEYYNIPIKDFTKGKLIAAAKRHLKINSSSMVPVYLRELNFNQFARERFFKVPTEEEIFSKPSYQEFKTNTKAYDNLKKYAMTDYGAIMIQRINNSNVEFTVYSAPNVQASGYTDFIKLPPGYPRLYAYPFSNQIIDPQATIHHEFEHTGFGSSTLPIGSLAEEVQAVVEYENPARILDGFEPRYVYYQSATDTTINVLNSKTLLGGRTFDLKDPRILK